MTTPAPRIIAVGLPTELVSWLAGRLQGVAVEALADGPGAPLAARAGPAALLLLDQRVALRVLEAIPPGHRAAVVCCLEQDAPITLASTLVGRFGVDRILLHPLDREDVAFQAQGLLSMPAASGHAIGAALSAMWERFKDAHVQRVAVLEDAAVALLEGNLDQTLRARAETEAHKLVGAVGTFGFLEGSRLARQAEELLAGDAVVGVEEGARLSALALGLREVLAGPYRPADPQGPADRPAPRLVIVDQDVDRAGALATAAGRRGLATVLATGVELAREAVGQAAADAVLLDVSVPQSMALLAELCGQAPPVPVVATGDHDRWEDRLEVARQGGRGYLPRSLAPDQVLEAIARALDPAIGQRARVLCVHPDPRELATLRALLESRGIRVTTLDEPRRLWDVLIASAPDLLLVAVEMPGIAGPEICRVIRNDPYWSTLPVLLLGDQTEAETRLRFLAAGGDEVLAQPISCGELVLRIRNRLERTRWLRRLADGDPLTGLANRGRAERELDRLISLASRTDQPLAVALLDADHLRVINDRHGREAGNQVVCRMAELLASAFRAEDLVAHWAGDQFLAAIVGMRLAGGVERVAAVVEALRGQDFHGAGGEAFEATFSAGVVQYPQDAGDPEALCQAATAALAHAKAAGRDCVRTAETTATERGADSGDVDVVVVDDDEVLAGLLLHGLKTRGYRTAWFNDGQRALAALLGPQARVRPRVALLDIGLPGMDGLSILRRLAREDRLRHTRVIFLTARASDAEVLAAMETGAFDHVAKPFSLPVLMERIHRAMEA